MMQRVILFGACAALLVGLVSCQDGVWSVRKPMLHARSDHSANVVTFANNRARVVVFGGCVENNACSGDVLCNCDGITNKTTAYDPDSDTWEELASAPVERTRHMAAAINSTLYVFGGRALDDSIITDVHAYNALTNTWSLVGTWPEAPSDGSAVVYNNTIYAFGGYDAVYNALNTTWTYRPLDASPAWSTSLAPLRTRRGDTCSAVIDGKVYVIGGWSQDFCTPLDSVERYDFFTNTWTYVDPMNVPAGERACAVMHGELHVFGGEQKNATNCNSSTPVRDVQQYVPAANDWTTETQLIKPAYRFAAVAWLSNTSESQLVVFGGQSAYNASTDTVPLLDTVSVFTDPQGTAGIATTVTVLTTGANAASSLAASFAVLSAVVLALVALF